MTGSTTSLAEKHEAAAQDLLGELVAFLEIHDVQAEA